MVLSFRKDHCPWVGKYKCPIHTSVLIETQGSNMAIDCYDYTTGTFLREVPVNFHLPLNLRGVAMPLAYLSHGKSTET